MVNSIEARLRAMQQGGEMERAQQEWLRRTQAYARRPTGVKLARALCYRATTFDPTIELGQNIRDAQGRVLFARGTRVNPLDYRPFKKNLCFVDGDDAKQVEWVFAHCNDDLKDKRILVQGDYLDLSTKRGSKLYFDQRGRLAERFGLTALPAVVRQSGRALVVEEFAIE